MAIGRFHLMSHRPILKSPKRRCEDSDGKMSTVSGRHATAHSLFGSGKCLLRYTFSGGTSKPSSRIAAISGVSTLGHYRKDCISFFTTTNCNLSCPYCYLQNLNLPGQTIDVEFAKQGIRDFFTKSDSRHIRFFAAGEPMIAFDKVREIRDFAFSLAGRELKVEVQTSGVFPSKVAEWMATNVNIAWLSCDGPPAIQNCLRPTRAGGRTSDIIERNIRILMNQGNDIMVGIRSTITPANLYHQEEMLEYFYSLGIEAVYSDPVFPPVTSSVAQHPNWKLDGDFMMEYAQEFLKMQQKAKELNMFYGSILTVNFDEKTEYFCRSCLPSPHLTTDGYVSCCDMAFLSETLPELIYGKFIPETGQIVYDQKKIAQIRLRKASNLVECQGCEVLHHCAGACFGEGMNETGRWLGVKKDYCEAIRFLANHLPVDAGIYPYLHP